jgi:hypothetical protein
MQPLVRKTISGTGPEWRQFWFKTENNIYSSTSRWMRSSRFFPNVANFLIFWCKFFRKRRAKNTRSAWSRRHHVIRFSLFFQYVFRWLSRLLYVIKLSFLSQHRGVFHVDLSFKRQFTAYPWAYIKITMTMSVEHVRSVLRTRRNARACRYR